MKKLSVVLAVRNEEKNLSDCLDSIKNIADEIVVVDEYSTDKTVEVAKKYGAKVYLEPHNEIFHVTKQKAIDKASGDWILQLDADEIVSKSLGEEIKKAIDMSYDDITNRKINPKKEELFERHQRLIEERDGQLGKNKGEIVAFFIPRKNFFLGKPLIHGGVYPDGVIRLIKKGKAHLPAKSVHEQMVIDGKIAWLNNDLEHHDSPNLRRYLIRLNRYTDLHARELKEKKSPKNIFYFFYYSVIKFKLGFLKLFFLHAGFKDGIRGFLWSFLSSMHYPIAYFKYWTGYN
ncbi:MAG: glycosyltransferase family 2 protein [Candidatus Woesebacteria bacterium]|nr:MAG: glycosyltransferase family 2 protein [Candidatus Woesebacteria bacterium]